jgi:2-polyprenyl-3-methyl-5-hydroxy-6-metoxy-1,4-benzoquinol methylase
MKEDKITTIEKNKIDLYLKELFGGIYSRSEIEELQESSLLMDEWSKVDCFTKCVGGMEEWAKDEGASQSPEELSCDWYHGSWQYMRLLNMVAVPRWYPFYHEALCKVLRRKPKANVMISACADLGMLHSVDAAIKDVGAEPTVVIYDICKTPLKNSEWYAHRHNLKLTCICDNIITSSIKESSFDLITTDEFLTVLQDPYKPLIVEKWKKLLKPDGTLVTTAMIGKPTTQELRDGYAERARRLFETYGAVMFPQHWDSEGIKQKLSSQFHRFAMFHTRHMMKDEKQLKQLFKDFKLLDYEVVTTAGECVNPTDSFQIVASPGG